MKKSSKIYIAGHTGLVGSSIVRLLLKEGFHHLISKTSQELDCRNQRAVSAFFEEEKPEYVFLAAAKVGGIQANLNNPSAFIYDNLQIQNNLIHASGLHQVKKLLFIGSSCIYPRSAQQPIREESLLEGSPEPSNLFFAIAKISGIKLCQAYRWEFGSDFVTVMPPNLYGPNDTYDLENSHVVPALIRKIHEAKKHRAEHLFLWGSGKPKREFLHVDDLAAGLLLCMLEPNTPEIMNMGSGVELTIAELAQEVKQIIGYRGMIHFDPSRPDGSPGKLMDSSIARNNLHWQATIPLRQGIKEVYQSLAREPWY